MGTVKKMSKVMQEDKHTCDSKHMAGDDSNNIGCSSKLTPLWPITHHYPMHSNNYHFSGQGENESKNLNIYFIFSEIVVKMPIKLH